MDPDAYQRWWTLHLRVARNENLTAEEKACYEAGLKQLQQEEVGGNGAARIRELRAAVSALQADYNQLHAKSEKLETEITALEASLDERGRQLLGVED
jgi:hypothetical protein